MNFHCTNTRSSQAYLFVLRASIRSPGVPWLGAPIVESGPCQPPLSLTMAGPWRNLKIWCGLPISFRWRSIAASNAHSDTGSYSVPSSFFIFAKKHSNTLFNSTGFRLYEFPPPRCYLLPTVDKSLATLKWPSKYVYFYYSVYKSQRLHFPYLMLLYI